MTVTMQPLDRDILEQRGNELYYTFNRVLIRGIVFRTLCARINYEIQMV